MERIYLMLFVDELPSIHLESVIMGAHLRSDSEFDSVSGVTQNVVRSLQAGQLCKKGNYYYMLLYIHI